MMTTNNIIAAGVILGVLVIVLVIMISKNRKTKATGLDWTDTDSNSESYIHNKPKLPKAEKVPTRVCKRCLEEKPLGHFATIKLRDGKIRYRTECRACRLEQR